MMRNLLRTGAVLALAALAGCGSDSADPEVVTGACTTAKENAAVLARANDWYLYQELIPGSAQYAQLVSTPFAASDTYASPQDLLNAFTAAARAQNEDRGWSYLLTQDEAQQYFEAGQTAGYGYGYELPTSGPYAGKLVVVQVMNGSPAAQAGFMRGDVVTQVGSAPDAMTDVATLVAQRTLGDALSGTTTGTVKYLSVIPRGEASAISRTMTSDVYDLDPVVSSVVTSPGGKQVGYVLLRTFVATADAKLRDAFGKFKQQGVEDVVIDVRYNGGGLLETAQVLASLLHPTAGDVMYSGQYNARHTDQSSWTAKFSAEASGLAAVKHVAFISTSGTASASELVPNALGPYLGTNLAIVGDRTYGKPVGQQRFPTGTCQDQLFLISFRLANKAGFGGYYAGLPDASGQFGGTSCAADDDLAHDLGDPAESSTAQALAFIDGTPCPPIAAATATAAVGASQLRTVSPTAVHPRPDQPSPAQREMPGLF